MDDSSMHNTSLWEVVI